MSGNVPEFFRAVWRGWLSRLSGPASVLLAILGFLPLPASGKVVFWITAALCFVFTLFAIWAAEHNARIRLEEEGGPRIFVELVESERRQYLRFKNTGKESAENVQIESLLASDVQTTLLPESIPAVHPGEHRDGYVVFFKTPSSGGTLIAPLIDFLRDGQLDSLCLNVLFQNSKGTRFRQPVRLKRVASLDAKHGICCYGDKRGVLG